MTDVDRAAPAVLWAVVAPSGVTATFESEAEARAHLARFDADMRARLGVVRYVRAEPEHAGN